MKIEDMVDLSEDIDCYLDFEETELWNNIRWPDNKFEYTGPIAGYSVTFREQHHHENGCSLIEGDVTDWNDISQIDYTSYYYIDGKLVFKFDSGLALYRTHNVVIDNTNDFKEEMVAIILTVKGCRYE